MTAVTAYVGAGSNVGDRAAHLAAGVQGLARAEGLTVTAVSPTYAAPAWGLAGAPYLNLVVALTAQLEPEALLAALTRVEAACGRVRPGRRWADRTLDLDLLLYGDRLIRTPRLTVPHPKLAARAFVLKPLADLAPGVVVPGTGRTVAELLAARPVREREAVVPWPPGRRRAWR